MAEYNVTKTDYYHAGGGTWLTICEVEYHFPAAEIYSPSEIAEFEKAGEQADWYVTKWIVVGCEYLNVYDVEPFSSDSDERIEPIESYKIDEFEPVWLMENNPGLDLWDYCDPYWFYIPAKDKLVEHPDNLLFNACCWLDKFNRNKRGYC